MSATSELLEAIFGSKQPAFYTEFEGWLRSSRRFRAFAHEYRNKIRAKFNNARHAGALDDLHAELRAAALLVREQRFDVEYEHYAAAKQRGPDFTVRFKGHTSFNVEVRRLPDDPARLPAIICEKIGQLPAGSINLLWLAAGAGYTEAQLLAATAELHAAASRKDDAYFSKRSFADAAEFNKRYPRLSGILLHRPDDSVIWLNPQARHAVPRDLLSALRQLS
ncbi:MAG: hypothetical protein KF698_04420 [Anaerolineales bacterium]|nr:hypothetical protein [Anaerolineales bacterium]